MLSLVKPLFPFSVLFIAACLWKDSGNDVDDDDDDEQQIRIEGTEVGDCTDGADNDGDGRYDCDDDSCAGAPACQGDTGEGQDTSGENQAPEVLSPTVFTQESEWLLWIVWNWGGVQIVGIHISLKRSKNHMLVYLCTKAIYFDIFVQ